jgi:hypothetical protein
MLARRLLVSRAIGLVWLSAAKRSLAVSGGFSRFVLKQMWLCHFV